MDKAGFAQMLEDFGSMVSQPVTRFAAVQAFSLHTWRASTSCRVESAACTMGMEENCDKLAQVACTLQDLSDPVEQEKLLDRQFSKADLNNDGVLDFPEFSLYYLRQPLSVYRQQLRAELGLDAERKL